MAPLGIWGNAKGPNKKTIESLRANLEAKKAQAEKAEAKEVADAGGKGKAAASAKGPARGSGARPLESASGSSGTKRGASRPSGVPESLDAKPSEGAGFLSSVRDYIQSLYYQSWFDSGELSRPQTPEKPAASQSQSKPASSQAQSKSNSSQAQSKSAASQAQSKAADPETPRTSSPPRSPTKSTALQSRVHLSHLDVSTNPQTPSRFGNSPFLPSDSSPRNYLLDSPSPGSARERRQPLEGRKRRNFDSSSSVDASPAVTPRKSMVPVPTGWKINQIRKYRERELGSPAARKNADLFQQYVRDGYSPLDAASMLGSGRKPKQLKGGVAGQFEIRLDNKNRLTFQSDEKTKEVTILEVGGHT